MEEGTLQKTINKADVLKQCAECLKNWMAKNHKADKNKEMFPPKCMYGDIQSAKGDIDSSICPNLSGLLPEIRRPPEVQKDEKSPTPYEKSSTPHEDGRNKIGNGSQNSTFRQPNSSMGREDRKKRREALDLKILKLITYMYHVSMIARLLNEARTTIIYRLKKLMERRLIKPDGKSNARSYPKFYVLTSKGTEVLIQYEEGSSAYEPQFRYDHHANSFKSEILGGARPKGHHSYHPKNWTGEVFYGDGFKIRLTSKHAIVDIQQDLGADTEANLLLKYHTLAQNYLRQFSAHHNIQLSPAVEQNREPHRSIPNSHELAQNLLGPMGGELHDTKNGLHIDESDKDHKGEVEFVGKEGAKAAANFLHLVNQGPAILAKTRAKADSTEAKVNSFEKVLHSECQEIKADLRELKTKVTDLPLAIENQRLKEKIQQLEARPQEHENPAPKEKTNPVYRGVEHG